MSREYTLLIFSLVLSVFGFMFTYASDYYWSSRSFGGALAFMGASFIFYIKSRRSVSRMDCREEEM